MLSKGMGRTNHFKLIVAHEERFLALIICGLDFQMVRNGSIRGVAPFDSLQSVPFDQLRKAIFGIFVSKVRVAFLLF